MSLQFDDDQRSAIEAPLDTLVTVSGISGTGKTAALIARAEALALRHPGKKIFAGAPHASPRNRLRRYLAADQYQINTVEEFAIAVLAARPGADAPELIDDVEASIVFERAAEPLFLMEWAEFIEAQIDPEVPGLRAPERFLEAAFRLIAKLRNAQMKPEAFLETALKGATEFYARPPNLAHPDLLYYTKDAYRNSLNVDAKELQRQHRREVDLAKILEKLYRSYLDLLARTGRLTGSDAVVEATAILNHDPDFRERIASSYCAFLIDDAQELSSGELVFLQALCGPALRGVTFFGDRGSAIGTFSGARPDRVFALEGLKITLETRYRCPATIERAARHLSGGDGLPDVSNDGRLVLFRAATRRAEAAFIAEQVVDLLGAGAAPDSIAILCRSVANVEIYEEELLRRNVDVAISGDINIYGTRDVQDALALLWNVSNPFAHEWMLRTLSGRAIGLSDASVVTLCSEPEDAAPLLFEDLEQPAERRWDPKRDIRLGWNVVRGDQDAALSEIARERVQRFRALLASWSRDLTALDLPDLAAKVFSEGIVRAGPAGSARAAAQVRNLERLHRRIAEFASRNPDAALPDFLEYATQRMNSTLEVCEEPHDTNAVKIMNITSALGAEFDHVIIPNVRAGSFPRYYAPDAFLFSPSLGMIAKENVGDASASRTAKFTYYMFRAKTRESYNAEEARAFVYAMRRARRTLIVTASERPTRGLTSPEFLSQLQAARIPGSSDISDHWRPAHSIAAVRS